LDADIWQLVKKRNSIAHGETRDGIELADYTRLYRAANTAMTGIMVGLTKAANETAYLKAL
jgi:hypothetical protein